MLILSTVPVWMRIPFLPSIKAATLHLCCSKNECYLLVYGDPAGPGTLNTLRSHGAKNGTYYCLDYGTLFDTGRAFPKRKIWQRSDPKRYMTPKSCNPLICSAEAKPSLKNGIARKMLYWLIMWAKTMTNNFESVIVYKDFSLRIFMFFSFL